MPGNIYEFIYSPPPLQPLKPHLQPVIFWATALLVALV
jgi:hypothetical protein